MLPSV